MITRQFILEVIAEFESLCQGYLKLRNRDKVSDLVKYVTDKQKTVEKTKLIAPFFDDAFTSICHKWGYQIDETTQNGYDIIIGGKKWEVKMTFSDGDSWTGNHYSKVKVSDLILVKLDLNEDGTVKDLFFGLLDKQFSQWKGSGANTAFSNLEIDVRDESNLQVVIGNVRNKRKGSKYLGIIKESFN